MNDFQVMRTIENIGASGSRAEKEAYLSGLVKSDLGRFVVEQAYSSFITFGIRPNRRTSPPALSSKQVPFSIETTGAMLNKLALRELTGHAAEAAVNTAMEGMSADGAELLYLVLSKDLKCGIGEATTAIAAPGLFPTFAVMRAHHYEEKRVTEFPVRGEFKLDGNRNTFLALAGNGGFFTRSGKRVPALDFLVPTVMKTARACAKANYLTDVLIDKNGDLSFMLDGEAMMGLFEDTGKLRKKDSDAVGAELHLYDMLSYADFDASGPVGPDAKTRRQNIANFVNFAKGFLTGDEAECLQIVPAYMLSSHEEIDEFFQRARSTTLAKYLARGDAEKEAALLKTTIDKATGLPKILEGAMIKLLDKKYEKKKSYSWLKIKAEETEDLRIIGVYSGKAGSKYENMLGGAIVDRAGVEVRVGGGWSDEERAELWELWKQDAGRLFGVDYRVGYKGQAFALTGIYAAGATSFLSRLIEVEFHEVTPDGSLRHPRYVRFRDDKDGEIEDKEAA